MKPKILQVTTHMNIGGIANYILTLSTELERQFAKVIVVSSGGNLEDVLSSNGLDHKHICLNTKNEFSPKVLKAIFELVRIVKDEQVDLIHAHTRVSQVAAFFASRITGIPYVTTCHGFFKKRLRGIFDTWGEKVIAISDAVAEHLFNDLGVSKARIRVIYSGVDCGAFSKKYAADEIDRLKRELGLGGGVVVGMVGRLSPVKGQKFCLQAMKDALAVRSDLYCLSVGSGPDHAQLSRLVSSLGISDRVRFLPSDPDTAKYLALMDIFVFPSVKEGLGIALLEAMAAGKPCIASKTGGIENIITHGDTGMLVPSEDPEAISRAVLDLAQNAALCRAIGERAQAKVAKDFSIVSMAANIMKLYKEVFHA